MSKGKTAARVWCTIAVIALCLLIAVGVLYALGIVQVNCGETEQKAASGNDMLFRPLQSSNACPSIFVTPSLNVTVVRDDTPSNMFFGTSELIVSVVNALQPENT